MNVLSELQAATSQLLDETPARAKSASRHCRTALKWIFIAPMAAPMLVAAAEPGEWDIDTAVLFYNEPDRVQLVEPVISGTRRFEGEKSLNAKFVLDVLTGASPNGAVPSDQAQTYTRASGNGQYTTSAGGTPLDDTFLDTRIALSGSWSQPLNESIKGSFGLAISNEYDYLSLAVNSNVAYNFNKNNSTLSFGLAYAADSIDPEGGLPVEGACMFGASAFAGCTETSFEETRRSGTESKDTLDLLFGYTQVINPKTVAQFNYSISSSNGYHNDPFKVVSVVGDDGEPLRHLHESRPDNRRKQALFGRVKRAMRKDDVIDASYRFQTDNYGLNSQTVDLRYRWAFKENSRWLTPHIRWYDQSAVDFYRPFLRDGEPLPENYTADYRQGDFTAITLGFEYGFKLTPTRDLSFAVELYQQNGKEPDNAPGQLANKKIFPDLDAVWLRVNFDFDG